MKKHNKETIQNNLIQLKKIVDNIAYSNHCNATPKIRKWILALEPGIKTATDNINLILNKGAKK